MNALPAPGWVYRPLQVSELDAVMAVEQRCYEFPWSRGAFVDSLAAGYETEAAFAADGLLDGYRVAMIGVEEMHLLNLTVSPPVQGRGLAHALLHRLEDACRQLALPTLWLEVRPGNQRALALYRRHGFQEVGRRRGYYPAAGGQREDAVVMRLALTDHGLD